MLCFYTSLNVYTFTGKDLWIILKMPSTLFEIHFFFLSGDKCKALALIILSLAFLLATVSYNENLSKMLIRVASKASPCHLPDQKFPTSLIYHPSNETSVRGKFFNEVNEKLLSDLQPTPVSINGKNIKDFTFVTAISDNYYQRHTALVKSIQTYFPKSKLVIYDLGLTEAQLKSVSTATFSVLIYKMVQFRSTNSRGQQLR